jgi:cell wall assembly regulator SMI1
MIEFIDHRQPASPDEVAAVERRLADLGQSLPPSYKAFLAEHDGGIPRKDGFRFEHEGRIKHDRVKKFLGIAPPATPAGTNLVETALLLAKRVPPGVLPIADDPFGNLICLDGRDGRDGPVLFWDHAYEGDTPDEANLHQIAPDLETFLASLIEDPDPAQALPDKPTGWRRILRRR